MEIINYNEFNIDSILFEKLEKRKGIKNKKDYCKNICAFDIETTNIDKYKQSIMYIWQFQIDDTTIVGRYWNEFKELIDKLNNVIDDLYLVVFVHNLSFEWQFIKSIIDITKVFAMDNRKILKCESNHIEFRCSYLHSNMSLEKFIESVGGQYKKVKGFNYKKKRYPWTKLSKKEMLYCVNDVRGLVDAIKKEMEKDNDDLYTYPLTSTGYVRREFKNELMPLQSQIKKILPSFDVMLALRACFRGGNTHANRHNANRIIEDVKSKDISSSYPAQMLKMKVPYKFEHGDIEKFDYYLKHGKAVLFKIKMFDIKLINESWGCPYLAKAKCDNIINGKFDNGRILSCDYLECWINEIDFSIIVSEYKFEYDIEKLYYANKKLLPIQFRKLLFSMYQQKTELKGVDDYFYGKYKNKVNSSYGLMVQNPLKANYILQDGLLVINENETIDDLYKHYQHHGWLPYQWGVWITSYARLALERGMHAIPMDAFIYADTDSIKYVGDFDSEFEKLNDELRDERYMAIDKKGNKHYIGIFEDDGNYNQFKTLGAKKYVYTDDAGLHVTIAGVNKKKGAKELKKIENFKIGFTFKDAGGTESIYNDNPTPSKIKIQNHEVEITSNIAIYDSTYTVGLTEEYSELLNFLCDTDIRHLLHYEY